MSLGMTSESASEAFDRVARAHALACEARTKGERERANAIAMRVTREYIASLDEQRATLERMKERLTKGEREGEGDAMET